MLNITKLQLNSPLFTSNLAFISDWSVLKGLTAMWVGEEDQD